MSCRTRINVFLFVEIFQFGLAWNLDSILNITVSIGQHRNINCITIFKPEDVSYQEETEITKMTKALQKEWTLARMSTNTDLVSHQQGCSRVLIVFLGWHHSSQEKFAELVTKKQIPLTTFLLLVPSTSTFQDYIDDTILPFMFRYLAVFEAGVNVVIHQIWRIDDGFPLRSVHYGLWTEEKGLICPKPNCPFYTSDNLEGVPIRGATKDDMPISGLVKDEEGNPRLGGYFGEVFYALADTLNATATYVKSADNSTGSEVNGQWNGLIGMLIRNETDFAVGPMSFQGKSLCVTDFVRPLLRTHFQVFFKQAGTMIEWDAFLKPFRKDVWGSILLWIIIGTYTLTIFYHFGVGSGQENPIYTQEFTKMNALMSIVKALCNQGSNIVPSSLSCRAVYLTGYLTSLILLTAYSGSLISKITLQTPLRPFDTLETFLKDGSYTLTAIARSTDYTYFSEASNPLLQDIFKKTMAFYPEKKLPTGKEEGMWGVCTGHKIALFITFAVTQITASDFRIKQSCPVLYFSNPLGTVFLTMGIRKNMPFSRIISHKLQIMAERGILRRLQNKEWPLDIKMAPTMTLPPSVEMQQVAPIYCILLFGLFLASLILSVEIASESPKIARALSRFSRITGCDLQIIVNFCLITTVMIISLLLLREVVI